MKSTINYVKKAEQNLLNICREFDYIMCVLDALADFGNKYCHEYIAKDEFFDGLLKMKQAVQTEHCRAIRKLFMFAGIGGKEAQEYGKEKFKEHFAGYEQYAIMHFLDKYGQIPSSYCADVEEEFRKQAKKVLESRPRK